MWWYLSVREPLPSSSPSSSTLTPIPSHPIPLPASSPQTGPWYSRAACAWWDWGRSPFGHCAKAWSHCDSELQNVPWCISALLPGWAWGAGRKRAGRGAQGGDTEKQWSVGAGDGRKGKQISGGGRKKPHQRIYKVAFTSLGGSHGLLGQDFFFLFGLERKKALVIFSETYFQPLRSTHFSSGIWLDDVPEQQERWPQGCWDMISFSSRPNTGLYAASLIGLLLICSATPANACTHGHTHGHTSSMDLSESTECFRTTEGNFQSDKQLLQLFKISVLLWKRTFKPRAGRQSHKHAGTPLVQAIQGPVLKVKHGTALWRRLQTTFMTWPRSKQATETTEHKNAYPRAYTHTLALDTLYWTQHMLRPYSLLLSAYSLKRVCGGGENSDSRNPEVRASSLTPNSLERKKRSEVRNEWKRIHQVTVYWKGYFISHFAASEFLILAWQ